MIARESPLMKEDEAKAFNALIWGRGLSQFTPRR
jgi:hypothetical protein